MQSAPKSMRLHIGLFGRTNVGKSSLLNLISNEDKALVSAVPGTTTDIVEKSIELLPIGPCLLFDTAGIDDVSELSSKRIDRTNRTFDQADIIIVLAEPNKWTEHEEELVQKVKAKKIPYFIVVNKIDIEAPSDEFIKKLNQKAAIVLEVSSSDKNLRNQYLDKIKDAIIKTLPSEALQLPGYMDGLLPQNALVVLITPIDSEAPKGRLILPQVQALRDALDKDAAVMVVKETEYLYSLSLLNRKPDLVVCDSQVVNKMVEETPPDIKCTTFSILLSRMKGDLAEQAKGAAAIDKLLPGDKILVAEACSHHANDDDIGRVKLPRWIKKYLGFDIQIDHVSGRDYPENLKDYKLVIHCGGCMLTRKEQLMRIQKAKEAGVPITNYGIAISLLQGVLERVLSPFEDIQLISFRA